MEIVIEREGGSIELVRFDATVRENFQHSASVTSHPVDKGSNVSDHVHAQLPRVTATVVVSNTPAVPVDTQMDGVVPRDGTDTFNVPLPKQRDEEGREFRVNKSVKIQKLTFDGVVNRVSTVWELLLELQTDGIPVELLTDLRNYSDMVLESISTERTVSSGTSIVVDVEFKKIRQVETRQVAAPERANAQPEQPRGQPSKNKGNQPSEQDEEKEDKVEEEANKDEIPYSDVEPPTFRESPLYWLLF